MLGVREKSEEVVRERESQRKLRELERNSWVTRLRELRELERIERAERACVLQNFFFFFF